MEHKAFLKELTVGEFITLTGRVLKQLTKRLKKSFAKRFVEHKDGKRRLPPLRVWDKLVCKLKYSLKGIATKLCKDL